MRNSYWILFAGLLLLVACRKEEPVIQLKSGLTRVEYEVNDPFEMPEMVFEFAGTYNLSQHTSFGIDLLVNEESGRLNLKIMLEDKGGHKNDAAAITLLENDFIIGDEPVSYRFNLAEYTGSVTSPTNEIDLSRITKIHIYINAGLTGKITSGTFWLDKISFRKS